MVLPAPFGPSRPKTVPCGTSRSTPSSAASSPNRLTSPSTRIAMSLMTEDLPTDAPRAASHGCDTFSTRRALFRHTRGARYEDEPSADDPTRPTPLATLEVLPTIPLASAGDADLEPPFRSRPSPAGVVRGCVNPLTRASRRRRYPAAGRPQVDRCGLRPGSVNRLTPGRHPTPGGGSTGRHRPAPRLPAAPIGTREAGSTCNGGSATSCWSDEHDAPVRAAAAERAAQADSARLRKRRGNENPAFSRGHSGWPLSARDFQPPLQRGKHARMARRPDG